MNIVIGEQIKQPKYKNQFKVVCKWMHGDADSFEPNTIFFDEGAAFEHEYRMHLLMLSKRPSEDWYKYRQKAIELTQSYMDDGYTPDGFEDYDSLEEYVEQYWDDYAPYDAPCDCSCSLWEMKVTYFNENGIEHEVTIGE